MAQSICECCGRKLTAPKSTARIDPYEIHADTSRMNDADMRAHYKRIAPMADLRATLSHAMSPALRERFAALDAQGNRATFYREYHRCHAALRIERNVARRRARINAGQTQSIDGYWHDAEGRTIN